MRLLALNPQGLLQRTSVLCCCLRLSSGLNVANVKQRSASDTLPRLYVGPPLTDEDFCGMAALYNRNNAGLHSNAYQISKGNAVHLSKDQSHYLTTVLRRKNKQIRIFDGSGDEWIAEVHQEGRTIALAQPYEKLYGREDSPAPNDIWLCFPPIKKRDRMRWLIEKTTELGCSGYIFLDADYSERANVPTSKLLSYAVEASEQCERLDLPRFVSAECPMKLTDLMKEANQTSKMDHAVLVCRERSNAVPLLKAFERAQTRKQKQLFLLIGPEGGWSPVEEQTIDQMQELRPDTVVNVSLGSRILRAETASISALAAHQLFEDAHDGI